VGPARVASAGPPQTTQSPMTKRYRSRQGDIFVVDIDERRVTVGHVLFKNVAAFNLYVCFFKPLWLRDALPNLSELAASEIVLIGGTMDALIYHGRWRVIGNIKPDLTRIPLPLFKVMIAGHDVITSFYGEKVRDACGEDIRYYDNHTSRAPMAFQDAIRAYHGLGPPPESMAKMTFEYVVGQSRPNPPDPPLV
jgi:hypothetical protein